MASQIAKYFINHLEIRYEHSLSALQFETRGDP